MSSNDRLQRAPQNPMSDEQYEARYGTPRKCMYCTNSKRKCTGGKPCDTCQNVGRTCKTVNGEAYVASSDSNMKTKVVRKAKKRKLASFDDEEDGGDKQDGELNGAVDKQRVVGSGVLGYAEQGIHRGPSIPPQATFEQPANLRPEHNPSRIRVRVPRGDVPNDQSRIPHASPPRKSIPKTIQILEDGQPRDEVPFTLRPGQWDHSIDTIWDHTGGTNATRVEAKASMNEPLGQKIWSWAERMKDPDKYLWPELQEEPAKAAQPARGSRNKPSARKAARSKKSSKHKTKNSEQGEECGSESED